MRIISQCGMLDINYDFKDLSVKGTVGKYKIVAGNIEIGFYTHILKALEVTKRIREQSEKESICYEHKFIEHTNEFVIDYTYVANGFFYMPQDKEVVIDNG